MNLKEQMREAVERNHENWMTDSDSEDFDYGELTIKACAEVAERYAEGFAEWKDDNGWIRNGGNAWRKQTLIGTQFKTTAELRALYDEHLSQSINQNQNK